MTTPFVELSPNEPIAHAKESDYDHWIGFVCQKIDRAAGFEVDVQARVWSATGPIKVLADDARSDRIHEALLELRDEFLSLDALVPLTAVDLGVEADKRPRTLEGFGSMAPGAREEDDHGSR